MKRWRTSFVTTSNSETWYDIIEDYPLIEASFAQQYGIRLRVEEEMPWDEFTTLLSGLNHKTPLGNIVAIRSENDPEHLKNFSPDQRRIRNEWRKRASKQVSQLSYDEAMKSFESMFLAMAKQND